MPSNLPFQFDGSHTSTLISESLEGVSVSATRQNAGRSLKFGAGPRPAGATKSPAPTEAASVTVAFVSFNDAMLSHGFSEVAAIAHAAPPSINTVHPICFRIISTPCK